MKTPRKCDKNPPTLYKANGLSIDVLTNSPQRVSDIPPNPPTTFCDEYQDFYASNDREEDDRSVAMFWLVRNGILQLDRGKNSWCLSSLEEQVRVYSSPREFAHSYSVSMGHQCVIAQGQGVKGKNGMLTFW